MKLSRATNHILAFSLLCLPVLALAQVGIKSPIEAESLDQLIYYIIKAIRIIAIPFIVIMIMWNGWKFIVAQGNADKLKEARKSFIWIFVGALILLSAELLAEVISNTIENLQ